MNKDKFGELLAVLRKQNGMSQRELAEKMSVTISAVSKWEHGNNCPDITTLSQIAEIFHVSCDDLHHPEQTLESLFCCEERTEKKGELASTLTEEDSIEDILKNKTEKRKGEKKYFGVLAVIVVGIIIFSLIYFQYHSYKKEMQFQRVAERYIDDAIWGNTYEIAYVIKGSFDSKILTKHIEEIRIELKKDKTLKTQVVKVSYYGNVKDAENWENTDTTGYIFLDVE